ncbi:2-keto-4-pentenoate hydratase [Ramlibacter tataouinensis]|uniref:4-oxalocrotonate decarboxylase-like protein n=1 Tax=Ramlibacter tataouinensis (strain ATCC BAA-407 / DSM 14655 / LMG 21543 / TTB310) TaxID=365046 RepID=F5Y6B6_RAMTT|nr:hydratase [Ramlibacter tataouinensis]AEG92802.1 4-oxalocrotonate decarboxylase-like protein [Ramlibacter tataouinensis TTB310]
MSPEQLLTHHDQARLWPAPSGLDLDTAYEHALTVRRLRMARGERPRGFKVGFTNRGIWPRYNVFAPIWGTVWDGTLAFCEGEGELALAGTCQPRLEPEAVFGLAATPPPAASDQQLWACLAWVAPGFEVVQSHLPDWKFAAGDTVADGGLHARLLVGRRVPVREVAPDAASFGRRLAAAQVALHKNGQRVEQGAGRNVLDGPLQALQHFVRALRACPGAPDLQPGDVVTTGTWTDAWPVAPGERWSAEFDAPLAPLTVRFG